MHYLKIILLLLASGLAVNADGQLFKLDKAKYSVDTGICTIGSVVQFRSSLVLYTNYPGCRYGSYIDFGDGMGEQKRDTTPPLRSSPVFLDYVWKHVYSSPGMKTIKVYLTDSNDIRLDSIINTYDVGNCKKAFGLMHSQAKQNCEPDYGEDVFESEFVKISKNFKDMYIMTDSNSYYNLPVFINDTFSSYNTCPSKRITYTRPGGNFPIACINNEWAYFDTMMVSSQYVCFQQEPTHFYWPRLYSSGSAGHDNRIKPDFGDGDTSLALFSINTKYLWDIDRYYTKPGVYNTRFVLYNKYKQPLWHDKVTIYVDTCRKMTLKLYFDADSNCAYDKGESTLDTTYIQLISQKGRSGKFVSDLSGVVRDYNIFEGDTVTIDTLTWYKYRRSIRNPYNKLICSPVITYDDSVYYASYKPRQVYGYLYKDVNANCVFDTAEPPVIHQSVLAICNDSIVAVTKTDTNGMYVLNIGNNKDYTLRVSDVNIYGDSLTCSASAIAVAKYGPDTRNDFAYRCSSVKNAGITMYNDPIALGDTANTYVRLNYSFCDTGSTFLKVTLDTSVQFVGSSLTPVLSTGNILWYYLQGLIKYVQNPLVITYAVDTNVNIPRICHKGEIQPLFNDFDITDNVVIVCDSVRKKAALDKRLNVQTDSIGNTYFVYTISATNDSVQQVYNVRIIDTLDSALDPNSVIVLGNSHPVLTNISGNVIRFTFYNTRISAVNGDTNSAVYVRFKVSPTLPMTTTISNNAGVYFDGEKVGQTNAVLYSRYPNSIVIAGNRGHSGVVYPNPVKDILYLSMPGSVHMQLYDVLGRRCETRQLDNGSIDMSLLPVGNYVLQVINKEGERSYHKVVKQ